MRSASLWRGSKQLRNGDGRRRRGGPITILGSAITPTTAEGITKRNKPPERSLSYIGNDLYRPSTSHGIFAVLSLLEICIGSNDRVMLPANLVIRPGDDHAE